MTSSTLRSCVRVAACAAALSAPCTGLADETTPGPPARQARNTGPSIGFAIHRMQDDLGVGANASSPAFLWRMLRATVAGGAAWYPHAADAGGIEDWRVFYHARLALEIGPPLFDGAAIRPYGFAGADLLVLPSALSKDSFGFGGLGGFGFEFEVRYPRAEGDAPVTFFVELGAMGSPKRVDVLAASPLVANGFLINVGLRAYP